MSHPILERHLKRRALKPLYLFYGDEEFLMQRALARLEEGLAERFGEAPVRVLREAQEVELAEFLAESRVPSLWGPGQLLVLRQRPREPQAKARKEEEEEKTREPRKADLLEPNAQVLKAVSDYLDHPAPRSWVVLLAAGLKARDLGRNPVWQRLARQEAALGFFHLKEAELYQWLTREAAGLGKSLSLAAAQRFVAIVGGNLAELSGELTKLALYAGAEKSLTPNLVNQLATHSRTHNIFALMEALGEPGAPKRLGALDQLLDLGEPPPKILVMLARQLRQLIRLKEGAAAAGPADQGVSLNLPPAALRRLPKQAAHFSEGALRAHLALLHQIDWQLKTSAGSPRLWLEWALLKMGPG